MREYKDISCGKIKQKIVSLLALFVFLVGTPLVSRADDPLFSVVATDTIAGYSSTIKAFDVVPDREVVFRVEKPDGKVIEINETADEAGVAELNFLGFHTKKAGTYDVWVYESRTGTKNASHSASFEVYPDSVSSVYSRIQVFESSAPANGVDPVRVRVWLRDIHENPIPSHFVELISSRESDEVEVIGSGSTDQYGETIFHIRSEEEGVAYFSVLDRNSGIILEERAKAIFFEENPKFSQGGELFQASTFQPQTIFKPQDIFGDDDDDDDDTDSSGIVSAFDVALESPRGMKTDTWDLIITAVDDNGNKVSNYSGNIVISASHEGVQLPPRDGPAYNSFGSEHQGVRGFYKEVTFPASGEYTIEVLEFDLKEGGYTDIKGIAVVEVSDECQKNCESENPDPEGNAFEIEAPKSQSTYGEKTIIIQGVNKRKNDMKVYLNDREVTTIEVDSDTGVFFDNKSVIAEEDGEQKIVFTDVETLELSEEIVFFVDGSPPELISQDISPDGTVELGEMLTVTILTEQGLSGAILEVKDTNIQKDFTEDTVQPGKYTATFRAPDKPGEYSITIELTDKLEHISRENNALIFTVGEKDLELKPPVDLSYTSEGGSATIMWSHPSDVAPIEKYFIYTGAAEDTLTKFTEVEGNITSKEINGLVPEEARYIAISSVDVDRNESQKSEVLVVTIEKTEVVVEPEPEPIEVGNVVQAIPGDGQILLRWDDPTQNTSFFDVRFGISSQVYTERFLVRGNSRSATVPDLINGVAYYLTVVPLNANGGPTREIYEEKYAMPVFSGIHKSPEYEPKNEDLKKVEKTQDVGPESIFLILFSLFFSAAVYFFHRAFIYYWM